jgi:hypothetical protein
VAATDQIPDGNERLLTTLAILRVNHEQSQSYLKSYLPFVYDCLTRESTEEVSGPGLQSALRDEFGIELPQAVVTRLLRLAERDGKLRREDRVYKRNPDALLDCSLGAERQDFARGYHRLRAKAATYAREKYELEWSDEDADRILVEYVDRFSSGLLAAALDGRTLPRVRDGLSPDQYALHRFVEQAWTEDPEAFESLDALVRGRMLSDALYFQPEEGQRLPGLSAVEVYFDGPILLWLLGYAGPEAQAPYAELVELLKGQGAILRCFSHSVDEAQEILDAAAARAWTGQGQARFTGDVVTYLVQQGRTRTDIELMAARLGNDLLRLGIQQVDTPGRVLALEPDEQRLQEMLQRAINYTNPRARDRDVDSLTAVHRLRGGRVFRNLAQSKALFVTRNYDVFRVSARFFAERRSGTAVPHCVLASAFTTLVWLHEPRAAPDLPRQRIIADVYAAVRPSDRLWTAYNDEIDRLLAAEALQPEDADYLRLAGEAEAALMDTTFGQSDAYSEGTALQVLELARASMRADLEAEVEAEREKRGTAEVALDATAMRVDHYAARSALVLSTALFLLLAAAVVVGAVFGPVGPIKEPIVSSTVQVICGVIAVGASTWTIINSGSLVGLHKAIRRRLTKAMSAAGRRALGLPAPPE